MSAIKTFIKIVIEAEDVGSRLDKVFAKHLPDISRSKIQKLIDGGAVEPCKSSSYKVCEGDEFELAIPAEEVEQKPEPQNIPIDIVYEDEYLMVINKSADMVVHPGAGNNEATLVNALLYYCGEDNLSDIAGVDRPGIVHRLDKETSGLMLVAKNNEVHEALSADLAKRDIKRTYNAIVWGMLPDEGTVDAPIGRSPQNRQKMAVLHEGGKEAVTDFSRLENFSLIASLAECRLHTGRTHQIRVHMAHMNHWVVGDPIYGRSSIAKFLKGYKVSDELANMLKKFPRQALHAVSIEFTHPINKDKMFFRCELPEDMQGLLKLLREC